MKEKTDHIDFTIKNIIKAPIDKKLELISCVKATIAKHSLENNINKLEAYQIFQQKFSENYNMGSISSENVSFIKKFFKVKSKKNTNFFDNFFYDGIEKQSISLLLKHVNILLNLINEDLIKKVPKVDLFITQKEKDLAYSIQAENAIVIEFSDFDFDFLAIQIFHEYIHFIEIYNPDLNQSNLNYIHKNMTGVESVETGHSKGYLYNIGCIDSYSGFVYEDKKTELLSNELMFFLKNPVDSLVLNTSFYKYLNSIRFFA